MEPASMPLPPGLLSTTTGCLNAALSFWAMALAAKSTPEPAPDATTRVMGRLGHGSLGWACNTHGDAAVNNAAKARRLWAKRWVMGCLLRCFGGSKNRGVG